MGNCELSYNLKDENGNTVSKEQQYFFISAYMTDGSPSRIYVTGGDTGYVGYVTMKNSRVVVIIAEVGVAVCVERSRKIYCAVNVAVFVLYFSTDGSPSRIYVTGGDTGYVGYVTMKNTDGTDYTGHCGGIAANKMKVSP